MSNDDIGNIIEEVENKVVYTNSRYNVEIDNEGEFEHPYILVSLEHGVVEGTYENLPAALGMAEQMAMILDNELWKGMAQQLFGEDDSAGWEGVFPDDDNEDITH